MKHDPQPEVFGPDSPARRSGRVGLQLFAPILDHDGELVPAAEIEGILDVMQLSPELFQAVAALVRLGAAAGDAVPLGFAASVCQYDDDNDSTPAEVEESTRQLARKLITDRELKKLHENGGCPDYLPEV